MAKPIRIGIFYYPHNVEHSHVANELVKMLRIPSSENEYSPALLPVDLNIDSLRRKVALKEDGEFALYVVLGVFLTTALNELYKEVEPVPAIFVGVEKPVEAGVVRSLERPAGPMSGVLMRPDSFTHYAEFVADCFPRYRKVLLLYKRDALGGWLGHRAETSAKYLHERGIEVVLISVGSALEAVGAVKEYLSVVDCVLLLEGCPSTQAVDYLVRLCFRAGKILLANVGRAGIILGAPFSYGAHFRPIIREVVDMAHCYFDRRKSIETMAVRIVPSNRVLYVNEVALRMLGESGEFIEKLRKLADGETVVMLKYWPMPPPEEEDDRPFKQNNEED